MVQFTKGRSKVSAVLLGSLVIPVLAACGGEAPATAPTTAAAPTTASVSTAAPAEPTADTAAPTAEVAPTADAGGSTGNAADKQLIIGLNQPPDTLFAVESQSSATTQVTFGTGTCITNRAYDYQPTYCFDEFPTLENGGTVSETVQVDAAAISAENPIVVGGVLVTDTALAEEAGVTLPESLPQLTLTYQLNPDLKWEDGNPVTAADAVESFRVLGEPDLQVATRYVRERTISVEAQDDNTVVVTMAPGYLDYSYSYDAWPGLLSSAVYGGQSVDAIRQAESVKPLSFGPYVVSENVPNESTTLTINPNFPGSPKIGTIIYKYVTEADQLLAQLEAGEIDVVDPIVLNLGQSPKLDELKAAGTIDVQYVPATVWEHIDFGIERADGETPFFDDLNVRKAIAYAINRQEIIDTVLYGKTVVMNTYVPEQHPSFPTSGLEPYEYNLDTAKQLLTEAGWTAGSDGILEKDGRKFAVSLYTTEGNPTRQAVAEVVQANLKEVGIDLTLEFVPGPAVLFKNGAEGILSGRRFDLAMYAWVSGVAPSHDLYKCDQIPTEANGYVGQNNPGYCNPEFDAAARAAQGELDQAKRIELDKAAEILFNQELPTFPLYQRVNIIAFKPTVTGIELDPTSQVTLYNIDELDITE